MAQGTALQPQAPGDEFVVEIGPSLWRNIGKWAVAFLFFCSMISMLACLELYQLTAEGTAKRSLRRAVAALTEIDPLVDRNYDDLQQRARSAPPGATLALRDFPVHVPLTRDEALRLSKDQLRDVLLDRSADIMYRDGTSPLRAAAVHAGSVGAFSIAGLTDNALDFLRSRNHDILSVLTFALVALSAVLGVLLALLCRGFGRLSSVGAVVLAASAPLLFFGIGARFYMRLISTSDTEYLQREFLKIGQGLAWIPIRNGIAFTLLGVLMLAIGVGLARWSDRRDAPRSSTGRPYVR